MGHQLQPIFPIYEPEVAARAVYWAAHHKRREVFVGASTPAVIYGQNLFPGLADWFLGKAGYGLQQTSQKVDPNRPNNLFQPVPGDFGAQGVLSYKALNFSLQSWASLHRGWAALTAGALAGAGVLLWKRRS